ncbi:hypothetical protein CEXT_20971 [Caerostris extrusa]|uniref:Uncharacterized protein n=1 Tax=Caerostris extrusa TaxID=172846 RepID=A0AAV4R9T3_CAEEX|nr:hypothetical protein CEXT_20971 [Caerostris extrusa]
MALEWEIFKNITQLFRKSVLLTKTNPINPALGIMLPTIQYQKDHIFKTTQEFYSFVTRGGQKFPEHTFSLPSTPADDLISPLSGVGMMNRPPRQRSPPHSGGRWIL